MRLLRLLAALSVLALVPAGSALGVVNGSEDGSLHPYVGLAHDGTTVCSGTLVSPTVFLTAAHCFGGAPSEFGSNGGRPVVEVTFDPVGLKNDARTSFYGTVYGDPTFCSGCGKGFAGSSVHDLAVVVLDAPVPVETVPRYAVLPPVDATRSLAGHATVDVVGYGYQGFTGGKGSGPTVAGIRAWAPTGLGPVPSGARATLLATQSHGANGAGPCFGDSGGPVLLHGTDTIVGVDSFVTDPLCRGVAYATRLDTPDELGFVAGFLAP